MFFLRTIILSLSIPFSFLFSNIEVADIFTDSMVLQRDMALPIWGTGTPNEKLKVSFNTQVIETVVDQSGKWKVYLKAMPANLIPQTMTLKGKNTVELNDILLGEVWVCSGQSNMAMGFNSIPELKKLYSTCKNGLIRSFIVPTKVSFEPQNELSSKWKTTPPSSAVAFSFSYHLQKDLKVPVGIIQTAWGSSSIEGWMPIQLTSKLPHFKKIMQNFEAKDKEKVEKLIAKEKWQRDENIYLRTRPNILYNSMLHPLIPFASRGLVWYQGEANSGRPQEYGESLPVWVSELRNLWKQTDFHFLPVMLPRYGRGSKENELDFPSLKTWASFREAQLSVLKLPNTAVANTIDLGAVKDIHPKDKAPIGVRLSKLAQRDVNKKKLLAQGPTFLKKEFSNNTIILHYDHAAGLKTNDNSEPLSFWVANEDQKWKRAQAVIKGQTIILSSENLKETTEVRYAFAAFPNVNLVNKENLPAYPFRTDHWKK